jgi:polar amino acid transport system substrate-binding protein
MNRRARGALLLTALFAIAGCTGTGASPTTSTAASAPAASASGSAAASASVEPSPIAGGLLEKVMKAGKLVVSTDPNYAPQSLQKPDGSYEGFDIDVANEIGKRLGVKVDFVTPDWEVITAGGWSGRWDASVGSMTITTERQKILDFSQPYYFTPAQMTVRTDTGITTIDGLSGKTVCAGKSTTYLDWLNGKTLQFQPVSPISTPPANVKSVALKTDQDCPQTWAAGRKDFEGWLSSSTTVQAAIDAGQPVTKVGDPVFDEPLAVAVDKSGAPDTDFVAKLDEIVQAMHDDGTLTQFSMKWFKLDLTQAPTQ